MIDLIEKYFDHPDIAIYHNDDMLQINQYDVSKALVSLAIEQSLVQVGGSVVLDVVSDKIFEKYQCHIPECYEHPEYLNEILRKLYGNAGKVITKSITTQLEEFNQHKPIKRFLEVICN